jgi:hypothetical protein
MRVSQSYEIRFPHVGAFNRIGLVGVAIVCVAVVLDNLTESALLVCDVGCAWKRGFRGRARSFGRRRLLCRSASGIELNAHYVGDWKNRDLISSYKSDGSGVATGRNFR